MVITAEGLVSDEVATCNALLEAGLMKLHIRKPNTSAVIVKALIKEIRQIFWNRIIVHEHHELVEEMNLGGYHIKSERTAPKTMENKHVSKSFHSFDEIQSSRPDLQYGFLSPIFNSISKKGYSSNFSIDKLRSSLVGDHRFPIYALGGITTENITITKKIGFDGAATIGSIWNRNSVSERVAQLQMMMTHT